MGSWESVISDDSDFYGDETIRNDFARRAKRKLKLPHQYPVVAKKRRIAIESPQRDTPLPTASENVLDFLKSRPQIAALRKDHADSLQPSKREAGHTIDGLEAEDLLHDDRYEGDPAAWQQDESISDFLKRAPVAEPATGDVGPWLWVSNPKIGYQQRKHEQKTDVNAFREGGVLLLQAFMAQRTKIESANPGKAAGTITWKLGPYRQQLEDDLLSLAIKTGTTCGKWMLFPTLEDLPRTWRLVAEATAEGKLGPTSKVATFDPSDPKPVRLICIYTYDFSDEKDVRRVLDELVGLGLSSRDGKPIYYKCDAYTYLHLESNNEYKIRASLFSSQDLLQNDAKVLKDGAVARLKKRNAAVDSFLTA